MLGGVHVDQHEVALLGLQFYSKRRRLPVGEIWAPSELVDHGVDGTKVSTCQRNRISLHYSRKQPPEAYT